MPSQIYTFDEFGGSGDVLHFAHANGYPPGSYKKLLEPLTKSFQVVSQLMRPLRKEYASRKKIPDWKVLADDLITFIEYRYKRPVYGAGHSMGAIATLIAASKRPDLFEKLIFIEPVLLPPLSTFMLGKLPTPLTNQIPTIKKALRRPDVWSSKEEAFDFHRSKHVFKRVSDEVLRDFIECGTIIRPDGRCTLVYKKDIEAHCYKLIPNVWHLIKSCKVPVVGFRGSSSDTLLESEWTRWKRIAPHHQLMEIENSTHLLPLEQPDLLSGLIVHGMNSFR